MHLCLELECLACLAKLTKVDVSLNVTRLMNSNPNGNDSVLIFQASRTSLGLEICHQLAYM